MSKTIDSVVVWDDTDTYACAVFIWNVAILERELDLLLVLGGQLVIAVDHVGVTTACLDQILNLLWSDASPGQVRMGTTSGRKMPKRTNGGIAS
jgi:hypothetical protein